MGAPTPRVCLVGVLAAAPVITLPRSATGDAVVQLLLTNPGEAPVRACWRGPATDVQVHMASQLRAGQCAVLLGRGLHCSEHAGVATVHLSHLERFSAADPAHYHLTPAAAPTDDARQPSLLEA